MMKFMEKFSDLMAAAAFAEALGPIADIEPFLDPKKDEVETEDKTGVTTGQQVQTR